MIIKKQSNRSEVDFESGAVVLIDKSKGKTSFDAVYKVRKALKVKKVGHAGTLDPEATGLLIICTGKKTKEINQFQNLGKTYTGIIKLGYVTKSFDTETEPTYYGDISNLDNRKIEETRDTFLGKTKQYPPMFSAVKHKGKALYKYARKGVEIERNERDIEIYKFDITVELPYIRFEIKCSKGTYIRVLASDFGSKLGCGGYLLELRRTAIGEYSVDDAFTIDEFYDFMRTN
jgi:tRNA pseudouridine55 synthase